jgi:excinuclease ABC subunit C
MELKDKLKTLPDSCGVYIMKDRRGRIIYVGKAISLTKRVRSYFSASGNSSPKISALVSSISDLEYIVTDTEKEALLLEYSLIKKYRPKYNTDLKDDKKYPFIKLTTSEDFPRLLITRIKKEDKDEYYGPYPDGSSLRSTLRWIRKIFPLRTCKTADLPLRSCLDYHIKRCLGPCIGQASRKAYRGIVKEVSLFLNGQHDKLLKLLAAKMTKASRKLNFEEATRLRNEIFSLKKLIDNINFHQVSKEYIFNRLYAQDASSKLTDLQKQLKIQKTPQRIEAFDISNISGREAVGSMVVFIGGEPANDQYRRFKIKMVDKINDYAMIKEVVRRRYARLKKEKKKLPDLILVDGGKGQLNAAGEVLKELQINNIAIIGLAKKFEHIFTPGNNEPVILAKTSGALHLLQHIRDEAHRFALAYHHYLRGRL